MNEFINSKEVQNGTLSVQFFEELERIGCWVHKHTYRYVTNIYSEFSNEKDVFDKPVWTVEEEFFVKYICDIVDEGASFQFETKPEKVVHKNETLENWIIAT